VNIASRNHIILLNIATVTIKRIKLIRLEDAKLRTFEFFDKVIMAICLWYWK